MPDGGRIIFKVPKNKDVNGLLEFINRLADEDTFITTKHKTKKEEIEYLNKIFQAIKEKKGITITAFTKNLVVGNGEVNKLGERREHVGHLGISVRQDFRNKGIGQALMKELIRLAKEFLGIKLVTLDVFSNNPRAIRLYSKLGFKQCGCIPKAINYKNHLLDNLIMYLNLK